MNEVMEDQKDKVMENLKANGMDLPTYLTKFQWDMAKYPIKQSLRSISEGIGECHLRDLETTTFCWSFRNPPEICVFLQTFFMQPNRWVTSRPT